MTDSDAVLRVRALEAELARLAVERDRVAAERDRVVAERDTLHRALDAAAEDAAAKAKRIAALEHDLKQFHRRFFGQRAERVDPAQLALEFERENEPSEPDPPPHVDEALDVESPNEEPEDQKRGKKRGKAKPSAPPERVPVELTLEGAARLCPCCGGDRREIGVQTSEVLDYEPARFRLLEYRRHSYACSVCEGQVVTAPAPELPILKGRPSPALVANLLVSKYSDHLPLHRLEGIYGRSGVDIARSTMSGWVLSVAGLLPLLVKAIKAEALADGLVGGDETEIRVLDPRAPGGSRKGRMWAWRGGQGAVVFEYTPTKEGDGPVLFLGDYKGYLQVDAYSGYDRLFKDGSIVEVACWAHVRRKFFEALETSPKEAAAVIGAIRALYKVERDATDQGLAPPERLELRRQRSEPLLKQTFEVIDRIAGAAVPGTPIAKAVGYAQRLRVALSRFLEDGRISLDNNAVERALRQVAVGRKNWEFAGSRDGAIAGALIYSVIVSCRDLGVDPYEYLKDILPRLGSHPANRIHELTPRAWSAARSRTPSST